MNLHRSTTEGWTSDHGRLLIGARKTPITLLCVINALGTGGAEAMLYRLLANLDPSRFRVRVVTLIDQIEPFATKIRALGIPVRSLGMRRGWPNPLAVAKLTQWIKEDPPDVIQTWLYHADLIGGLAARLAGPIPVVWGIHNTDLASDGTKRMTALAARLCSILSGWLPDRIVCCSESAYRIHEAIGYPKDKMVVIHNGADLSVYQPDPVAREAVRRELRVQPGSPIVGLVARFTPLKDHRNFIQAAGQLHLKRPDVQFLLCGSEVTWQNPALTAWIDEAGIRRNCHLLGDRHDVPRLMAAMDVATLSSIAEAFPMAVIEAMSCGVPCVVTDVGDSALIVGDTGRVVPPKDVCRLAEGLLELLDLPSDRRAQLGIAARHRIQQRFELSGVVMKYRTLFESLAASKPDMAGPSTSRVSPASGLSKSITS